MLSLASAPPDGFYIKRLGGLARKPGSLCPALMDEVVASAFDYVDPLSIPLERAYAQANLLAQLPADESTNRMGLPPSRFHEGLQTGSYRPFE
jgi:hypothetical protein